jgi:hypothetical protein
MYDTIFKEISDLRGQGWYTLKSHRIQEPPLIWEKRWWGDCVETSKEEQKKHITYAKYMGLYSNIDDKFIIPNYTRPVTVLDIGGGPASMLLNVDNLMHGRIYDPNEYPK